MRFKFYQVSELVGIVLLLGSTGLQLFYLEPLNREINWRLVAFSTQQNAHVLADNAYQDQMNLLQLLKAPAETVEAAKARHAKLVDKFQTADANIADYMLAKQDVEDYLQIIVMALFALGSLLAGIGRALELQAAPD